MLTIFSQSMRGSDSRWLGVGYWFALRRDMAFGKWLHLGVQLMARPMADFSQWLCPSSTLTRTCIVTLCLVAALALPGAVAVP